MQNIKCAVLLAHLSWRFKWAIVTGFVRLLSGVNFSHFWLLLCNRCKDIRKVVPKVLYHNLSEGPISGPWPLIGWCILDFFSTTAAWISTKLDRKALLQNCIPVSDPSTNMATLASDWLVHFQLLLRYSCMDSNETSQEGSTQKSTYFWGSDPSTNMAVMTSDWLVHF